VTSRNSVAMVTTQQSSAATQLCVAGQLEDCLLYGLYRGYLTTVPYRTSSVERTVTAVQFRELVRSSRSEFAELRATTEEDRRSACEDVKCDSAPIQEVRLEDLRRNTCSD
jgi:hypothetical protein